jgi:hypothetical protein
MDEWYDIAEAEDANAGEPVGCWLEVVKDENGVPLSGYVKAWPFEGPGKYSVPLTNLMCPFASLSSAEIVSRGKGFSSRRITLSARIEQARRAGAPA